MTILFLGGALNVIWGFLSGRYRPYDVDGLVTLGFDFVFWWIQLFFAIGVFISYLYSITVERLWR